MKRESNNKTDEINHVDKNLAKTKEKVDQYKVLSENAQTREKTAKEKQLIAEKLAATYEVTVR